MNLRIDLKIVALEPQQNGLTLIEALATDGTHVAITVRVAQPLAVGGWMTMALLAESDAAQPAGPAPSMRERMRARVGAAAELPAGPTSDASSQLISSILGRRSDTARTSDLFDSPLVARNVDDEMNALLGAPRKGNNG